jgi:hypothetical protein
LIGFGEPSVYFSRCCSIAITAGAALKIRSAGRRNWKEPVSEPVSTGA